MKAKPTYSTWPVCRCGNYTAHVVMGFDICGRHECADTAKSAAEEISMAKAKARYAMSDTDKRAEIDRNAKASADFDERMAAMDKRATKRREDEIKRRLKTYGGKRGR